MVEVYIDPSYTSTGITVLGKGEAPFLAFYVIQPGLGTMRSYPKYFYAAQAMAARIVQVVSRINDDINIYIESPPPRGFSASGLYGLSFLTVNELYKLSSIRELYHINPTAVKKFTEKHGVKDQKKRGELARTFLNEILKNHHVTVSNISQLDDKQHNDVATSFLFYVMKKVGYSKIELVWRK